MPKHEWTAEARLRHSTACLAQTRLTLAQKLKIIRYSQETHVSQARLADHFGKVGTLPVPHEFRP